MLAEILGGEEWDEIRVGLTLEKNPAIRKAANEFWLIGAHGAGEEIENAY